MILILGMAYLLVMGAGLVSIAVLSLRGKKSTCNYMYLIFQALAILWCASQIFILLAESMQQLNIACMIGNIGICFVGSFWYYFSISYEEKKVSTLEKYLPFCLSCFHYFMVLTNRWHHLYYVQYHWREVKHGIFFYTNVFTTYALVIAGTIILYRCLAAQGGNRTAKWLIITSVLIPVLLNSIYLIGVVQLTFDITPLGFGISAIFILLATIKYRFMEVNITAFDTILSELPDGVGVFDKKGNCTYSNLAFYQLLDLKEKREEELSVQRIARRLNGLIVKEEIKEQSELLYLDEKGKYLQIQIYQSEEIEGKMTFVSNTNLRPQQETVFMVRDMSEYYKLLNQTRQLAVTSERLALEKERNRIAGQVHDTAGHTLTMIQSYMKLAKVSIVKRETEKVEEYLEQARVLSGEGIRELRQSINQLRRESSYELVTQGIMQLADQVKEIPVEVTVQGEDGEQYSHLSKVLYDCVRESITNALKYAEAAKLEIILRFQKDEVELIIGDDGRGCDTVAENNGIRGIRERVENAGGEVRFISSQGEGFLTRLKLPL